MGFLSRLFGTDPDSVREACIKIYNEARKRRPGKPERDYLKLVLLTKPPFDYQLDRVIEGLLDQFRSIEALADYIAFAADPSRREMQKSDWEARKRNLKMFPQIKARNKAYFVQFWSG